MLEQKSISVRDRLAEVLPHSPQPEFVSTPLAVTSSSDPTPTFTNRILVITPTIPATRTPASKSTPIASPILPAGIIPIQSAVTLRGIKHDYQRWNNCGPTTLEMNLSYFSRTDTQAEIAAFTKPNPDDRDVRPDELAAYITRTGLHSITRVNGTLDRLKLLLSNGIPVIVETGLVKQPEGWMGHYRLLSGYNAVQFVTMDSYDGANLKITFDDLDAVWREFNRLYLIVYSDAQSAQVHAILSDTLDDGRMYTQAAARARGEIESDPKDA
ncbi:MAG TPA: C39 family peptidase, partial [Verrucomicrobiae bacterium]